ncbi:DUF7344 domain-containing protein [Halalkalicoccus jeotgali]|uniref:DUF7344 domain-containing protein n=1 Tax=Halalkalicoccus jeotgali (strain DSM 18796 / CECT 7217 / JCM 14584 / KCTC 4019 / B3) TaxID=795797 RepID=D8J7B8_HALJB|nr:hypothetical protein [Halalkalicoccus jeotgali]ADJ14013.1 hypothetical protein HacjB3_03100 [Halalkalicoccus jeotgali B3]ELY33941.1 hypothetical protein C497_16207 [Halalkalicoccus jeotgali B3]
MSQSNTGCGRIVSGHVPKRANRRRWYVLRYLGACTYPASVGELGDHVAPRVGADSETVAEALRERDLSTLADCSAIEYDADSGLACLSDRYDSYGECARRALTAGVVSHHQPPRLDWLPIEEPDLGDVALSGVR